MFRKKEKGFALILSLILLLAMSLMGGALIVISSGDHRSNNNSDQYQQVFYVAETGLMQGEKWVIDNYLGHWMTTVPPAAESLGPPPIVGEDDKTEVEAVEETPKEILVDKLKVTVQPGQSEEMGILNAMFNDTDGVMSDERKMELYKLYIPQFLNL